jgi:DNA-binding NtrC family response regulator
MKQRAAKKMILVVEDNPEFQEIMRAKLLQNGYEVEITPTAAGCLELLQTRIPDTILLDMKLPDAEGQELLREIRKRIAEVPVIVMTAYGSERTAVECMKHGAEDYLKKPIDLDELVLSLEKCIKRSELRVENIRLKRKLGRQHRFHNLLGMSPAMQEVFDKITSILDTSANVFIEGETGTGKEMVAAAIHHEGSRRDGPFVPINCAAIPENLFESELFGHVKGAFTGAIRNHTGKIVLADGGTLFLDEVSEMPPRLQAKLLRVIQDGEVMPVGGTSPIRVDVRFVAATNRELDQALRDGSFRQDLYYRLAVVTLKLPPLRERAADILLLAEEFLRKSTERHGKSIRGFSGQAREALVRYHWPGNVRELENKIERAVLMCTGEVVEAADLELGEPRVSGAGEELLGSPEVCAGPPPAYREAKSAFERRYLEALLRHTRGNVSVASQISGIHRPDIYRMVRKHGLDIDEFRSAGE